MTLNSPSLVFGSSGWDVAELQFNFASSTAFFCFDFLGAGSVFILRFADFFDRASDGKVPCTVRPGLRGVTEVFTCPIADELRLRVELRCAGGVVETALRRLLLRGTSRDTLLRGVIAAIDSSWEVSNYRADRLPTGQMKERVARH